MERMVSVNLHRTSMIHFKNAGPDGTPNPWKTHTERIAYDNPWIQIRHREVTNPSGGPGIYGVVHFKNIAIGIVPLDDDWNTWLVGQYRYTLGRYSWEIPEGGCPEGTDMLESAQRELLEETGISAKIWTPLLEMHTSNSVTDEYGVAYMAQGLTFGEAHPEETEDLRVRKMPLEEAVQMVLNGDITDSLSMIALMKVELLRKSGQL
jgi:8-oxo-dGTP pyrophosphatase MutT (NUDIX family)